MLINLIICGIVGFLAGRLTGNKTGMIRNIIVGLAGGWLGDRIFFALGLQQNGRFGPFLASLVGAVVFLSVMNAIFGKRR